MIETVKNWVFNVVVFIVTGAVGVAWYFYSLSRRLKDKLSISEAEKQLGESVAKQAEARRATEVAEKKYEESLSDFNNALDDLDSTRRGGDVQ